MASTTIQVSDETRKRLDEYKIGGMSYEDVIGLLMEILKPEKVQNLYREWQSDVAEDLRNSKKWKEFGTKSA